MASKRPPNPVAQSIALKARLASLTRENRELVGQLQKLTQVNGILRDQIQALTDFIHNVHQLALPSNFKPEKRR